MTGSNPGQPTALSEPGQAKTVETTAAAVKGILAGAQDAATAAGSASPTAAETGTQALANA
jgi:hypothetical protein